LQWLILTLSVVPDIIMIAFFIIFLNKPKGVCSCKPPKVVKIKKGSKRKPLIRDDEYQARRERGEVGS
jgi:hypothetical protein